MIGVNTAELLNEKPYTQLDPTHITYSSRPAGKLIDPLSRHGSPSDVYDVAPCGNMNRGTVSYEGYPGQFNEVAWEINEPV